MTYVEEQWMICNVNDAVWKVGTLTQCLSLCSTLFVRIVKPLRMDEFADIVKERAFSWASIIRVKNTFGVKWSYEDKSRPLIGRTLVRVQTT